MRSIIQDSSDDWPPTLGGGITDYVEAITAAKEKE